MDEVWTTSVAYLTSVVYLTQPLGWLTCMAYRRDSQGKGSNSNTTNVRWKFTENRKMATYLLIWFPVFSIEWGSIPHNSHIYIYYHHSSITVFVCSFWPISGLVGEQKQVGFCPYWALQGVKGLVHDAGNFHCFSHICRLVITEYKSDCPA